MARARKATGGGNGVEVADYRHDDTRKNIPPAKIAAEGRVPDVPKITYSYSPGLIRPCASTGRAVPTLCPNFWRPRGNAR